MAMPSNGSTVLVSIVRWQDPTVRDLELRPWWTADAEALRRAHDTTPDLATQTGGADLSTLGAARDYIGEELAVGERRRHWAIVADGVVVGDVGLSAIERRHDTAWVSYWLAAGARGRGDASRAVVAASGWAFDEGLFRLELGHRVNNPASCAVATRAGFRTEGIERQKLRYGSRRYDVELHALLRTDPRPSPDDGVRLVG
jgi:ribosomal-protein-alanine N-acetyltransferase